MESLGEEREGILLSEVEVGIARQHIATAGKAGRSDFATRRQPPAAAVVAVSQARADPAEDAAAQVPVQAVAPEPARAEEPQGAGAPAAGALGGVAFGGLHTWMGPTGTGPLWKPEITASTVLHALVFALTVGVAYNAIPEEITLRRTLFSPIHERFGATAAVLSTTASFTALHLPTWLTSDTSLKGYAWQILHKVLFGLLAGWSVVRLRSMFFALGLHVSGNTLGLFIGQLQSENLPDFELSWLNAAILLTGAAAVAALILLLGRRRRVPPPVF